MPPWHADPHVGQFSNDPRLTQAEIDTITAWVDGDGLPIAQPVRHDQRESRNAKVVEYFMLDCGGFPNLTTLDLLIIEVIPALRD